MGICAVSGGFDELHIRRLAMLREVVREKWLAQKRRECAEDAWKAAGKIPSKTQKVFHALVSALQFMVGGYRAGKSAEVCLKLLERAYRYPGAAMLVCRQEYNTLDASTMKSIALALSWIFGQGEVWERFEDIPKDVALWRSGLRQLDLQGGSTIQFQHLKEVQRVGSTEYGTIWVEEGSEVEDYSDQEDPQNILPPIIIMLLGRLNIVPESEEWGRGKPTLFVTANYAGHNWIWQMAINAPQPDTQLVECNAYDIKGYVPEEWFRQAEAWPEAYKKRHLYGSWESFEGKVFTGFGRRNVCKQFPIPKGWPTIRGIDPGVRGAGWIWMSVVREIEVYRGREWPNLPEDLENGHIVTWWEYGPRDIPIEEACKYVLAKERNLNVVYSAIDPSDARQQTGRGLKTTTELLRDLGIDVIIKAPNDETAFILKAQQGFVNGLYWFTDNCVELIRQIINEAWDEKAKPGDERRKYAGRNHILAAWKYAMMMEPEDMVMVPAERERIRYPSQSKTGY